MQYTHAPVSIKFSIFISNLASAGGVIHIIEDKAILIENCTFSNNSASGIGGVVSASFVSNFTVAYSAFESNWATQGGVVSVSFVSNFTVAYSAFESNWATQGGVVYATNYAYIHMHDTKLSNNAAVLGIMYFIESTCIVSGLSEFTTNIGSLFAYNSNITIAGDATFANSCPSITNRTIFSEGGVITAFQSEVILSGLCNLNNNSAESGGAVYTTESQVYITGNITISYNTAEKSGGAIFLYQSELKCQGKSRLMLLKNTAGERGGAIHAISSSIKTTFITDFHISQIIFTENRAIKGGAVS